MRERDKKTERGGGRERERGRKRERLSSMGSQGLLLDRFEARDEA